MTRICCSQPMAKDTTANGTRTIYECLICRIVHLPTADEQRRLVLVHDIVEFARSSEDSR